MQSLTVLLVVVSIAVCVTADFVPPPPPRLPCKGGPVLLGKPCQSANECCYFTSLAMRGCDGTDSSNGRNVCCQLEGQSCNPSHSNCCSNDGAVTCAPVGEDFKCLRQA